MNPNSDFIPFARPYFDAEEEKAVLEVLRSGWLTTGIQALEFEREFAAFVRTPHALAVNSATSGLHLALEAFGIKEGDCVVTSPYTFASTAAVARQLGARVAFCDIEAESPNMDPASLERVLDANPDAKAVIPVHLGGLPCRMREILEISGRHGCSVIEDAAHAFPSETPLGFAGAIGDAGVYSFYATKTITTGEGGMIACPDPERVKRMSLMRSHGIDRAVWNRYTSQKASWYYEVQEAGFKYNLPDLLAAIGRKQLEKAWRFLDERKKIRAIYDERLSSCDAIGPPVDGEGHSWHLYQVLVPSPGDDSVRNAVIERLKEKGIGTSVHFIPLHLMPFWVRECGLKPSDFPNALARYNRVISLPIYPGMTEDSVRRAADELVAAVRSLA